MKIVISKVWFCKFKSYTIIINITKNKKKTKKEKKKKKGKERVYKHIIIILSCDFL